MDNGGGVVQVRYVGQTIMQPTQIGMAGIDFFSPGSVDERPHDRIPGPKKKMIPRPVPYLHKVPDPPERINRQAMTLR
jgi:hypothetical protein